MMDLTLEMANAAVVAAHKKAAELGIAIAVTVLDESGRLVLSARGDGASFSATETSRAKALASAAFRAPTSLIAEVHKSAPVFWDNLGHALNESVLPSTGAVPIKLDGKVIGAIGCGGALSGDQDHLCAEAGACAASNVDEAPSRMHHNAGVVRDLNVTHRFYTEVLGLKLGQTWCEQTDEGSPFCHCFYELTDGSCLAFFQFSDDAAYAEMKKQPTGPSPYHHIALKVSKSYQEAVIARAEEQGIDALAIDHGYCKSFYLIDPDNHIVEITVDNPKAIANAEEMRARAYSEMQRWLKGDHTDNNIYRQEEVPELAAT